MDMYVQYCIVLLHHTAALLQVLQYYNLPRIPRNRVNSILRTPDTIGFAALEVTLKVRRL